MRAQKITKHRTSSSLFLRTRKRNSLPPFIESNQSTWKQTRLWILNHYTSDTVDQSKDKFVKF